MHSVVDIDLDIEFENFKRLESWFMERLSACSKAYDTEIDSVVCKTSHSGNVHCFVKLRSAVDTVTWLKLQFCMGEDYMRFLLTLERLQVYGYPQRFMFTYKLFDNTLRKRTVCKE